MSDVPAVSVTNLTKTYRSGLIRRETVRALDGVTLSVPPGTIFGLLGPNGAGKSTMVKILLDVVHATAGEAALFGVPSTDPEARERVGFLPEDHQFPGFLTAEQVLHVYGRMAGVTSADRAERIPELLDRVGLAARSDSKVKGFSKGMAQRLGLAQALLNEPDLLFLDEPTDGVDPVGRREIRDLLLWLREQGTTVFLNSHLLSEVEKVCSRVAILQDGAVVRQGPTDELTAVDRVYDVTCTPVPDAVLDDLSDDGSGEGGGEGSGDTGEPSASLRPADQDAAEPDLRRYHVRADDRAGLNAVLDHLRSAGVELESVQPLRRTLEDYFIDVVGQEEKK
jgi:ABC-2 type transport system ATP-binding protein